MRTIKDKICFICEYIEGSIDEGIKKTTISLLEALRLKRKVVAFGREIPPELGHSYRLNKFFLNHSMIADIRRFEPDVIVYIPEASLTVGSFFRGKVISKMAGRPLAIIGLQKQRYPFLSEFALRFVRPSVVVSQSSDTENFYRQKDYRTAKLRSGIDIRKFRPPSFGEKHALRLKYGLPVNKKIALHVGHLNEQRGLRDLLIIAEGLAHVLIIASTSTRQDKALRSELEEQGATVIDSFVQSIEEVYRIADLYVFPTQHEKAAMEFPLSVLEAMACGLPILATQYGGLVDYFTQDTSFYYYSNLSEARSFASLILNGNENCGERNVSKAASFGWDSVADELLQVVDKL